MSGDYAFGALIFPVVYFFFFSFPLTFFFYQITDSIPCRATLTSTSPPAPKSTKRSAQITATGKQTYKPGANRGRKTEIGAESGAEKTTETDKIAVFLHFCAFEWVLLQLLLFLWSSAVGCRQASIFFFFFFFFLFCNRPMCTLFIDFFARCP
ncbi:hypothetical protein QG37_01540 [Candidozyma auris]|nr:hypothetical protein QG37_01540 [[Candida] auris]